MVIFLDIVKQLIHCLDPRVFLKGQAALEEVSPSLDLSLKRAPQYFLILYVLIGHDEGTRVDAEDLVMALRE